MIGNGETLGAPRLFSGAPALVDGVDQGQLLLSIAATLHDCLLSLDALGTVAWASPATEHLLGRSPQELAGCPVDDLLPLGAGERLRTEVLDRLLAGERVDPVVETVVRRDGSTFDGQLTLGPVHGPLGVCGAIVVLRDVSAQLSEQRQLAQALEMSRAHFDQALTPQAILDLHGRVESVNSAWCETFGRGEVWFAGLELLDLVAPVDFSEVAGRLRSLREGALDSVSLRCSFLGPDDDELSLVLDASVLREAGGEPYAIAVWVDADEGGEPRSTLADLLHQRAWDSAIVLEPGLAITYASDAVARMLGVPADELVGRSVRDYVHTGDAAAVTDLVARLRGEPRRSECAMVRVVDGSRCWRSVEVTAANRLSDPEIRGYVANLRDVTERVRSEEALRLSEALHRTVVESAQEGLLATAPDGLVLFANETAVELLGRSADSLRGEEPGRFLRLDDDARVDAGEGVDAFEVAYQRGPGDQRVLRVVRRLLASRHDHLGGLVSIADVTDIRQVEHALRRRALHDPLTGLPNRYLFLDRLETAALRQEHGQRLSTAVLYVDVDRFKHLNDGFGHVAGDEILRQVGDRLAACVRATDTVGRLGGDEFAMICEDIGREEAIRVAVRVRDAFAEPFLVGGHEHTVTASVGLALAPPNTFDDVVQRADEAMYRAKQRGGGRVRVDNHRP